MRLYYKSGASSTAAHIVLEELDISYDLEAVEVLNRKTERGRNYLNVNPHGFVPALELDNGEILTETTSILLFLAALKPIRRLGADSFEGLDRYRFLSWLGFLSTELHHKFPPLFTHAMSEERVELSRDVLEQRLSYIDRHLADKSFLFGDHFTVLDAYLFPVTVWARELFYSEPLDEKWPDLARHFKSLTQRETVYSVMLDERVAI